MFTDTFFFFLSFFLPWWFGDEGLGLSLYGLVQSDLVQHCICEFEYGTYIVQITKQNFTEPNNLHSQYSENLRSH